ncbi:MAG: ATP-binding protein, partial [Lentimicrobiaceae bacterium]|nr:ATP-binding protein [Lentimicrobiaceae bacterium]
KLELFYFRETHECDFVVFKDRKCQFLIQVCQSLTNDNLKRELDGLKEAMNFFKLNTGYVLTLDQLDTFQLQDGLVNVMPVYQFITSYSHP